MKYWSDGLHPPAAAEGPGPENNKVATKHKT